jgi:uncharacterized membrane protein YkvA (DUF1232 family)
MRRLWRRLYGFQQEVLVLYFALRDSRTPWYAKWPAFFSLIYLVSPIDLIPDFIPFVGYLDDLVMVPLLLHISFRLLPAQVREESLLKAASHAKKLRVLFISFLLLIILLLTGIFMIMKSFFQHLF